MAKLAVTVTVFFFVLAFSDAFRLSDRLGDDVIFAEAEPDPDTTNPSDLAQTGSAAEPDPPGSDSEPGSLASDEVNVPLTFVKFHPINRHFPRRPLTAVHFHRRPCQHSRNGLWGPRLEIPYGRDMILTGVAEAERVSGAWPLGRRYDDHEDDHVEDVENDQKDTSEEEIGSTPAFEMRTFPENAKEMKIKKRHRDEQEIGFMPVFPSEDFQTTRMRVYPQEKLSKEKIKMLKHRHHHGKEEDDKDEDKEHKGFFMKKVSRFLKHLV